MVATGGSFEFPNVPPGTYSVRTIPGHSTVLSTIVVADREITGIVLPAFSTVAGRVIMEDKSGIPAPPYALMIEAKRASGTTLATTVTSNGFTLPLVESEYQISFGKLPAGLSVKSISYGSTDLLRDPLKLDGSSKPTEIRVTLEKK